MDGAAVNQPRCTKRAASRNSEMDGAADNHPRCTEACIDADMQGQIEALEITNIFVHTLLNDQPQKKDATTTTTATTRVATSTAN